MSAFRSADTRFKKTEIERFPVDHRTRSAEGNYWKHLRFPVTVQEFGPVSRVDLSPREPHLIAVTASTRVRIFDPVTDGVRQTLTKFGGAAYGGRFRHDGRLLCAGGEEGALHLFDVETKSLLRRLRKKHGDPTTGGRGTATRCCDFTFGANQVAAFSDDRSVRLWDVATERAVVEWADLHQDYVRAGCVSETTPDIIVSGSYDHMVRIWDRRMEENSTHSFDHGSPVEAVMLLPNGALLASAGGHEIRIWDLLASRLLAKLSPHNKTITSLGLATNKTRIVSSSLDRQVKFHDISTFQTCHSISFPSPILTAAVAADDSMVCAGMSDGLVQFLHRKVPPTQAEKEAADLMKKKATIQHRYLQFTQFTAQPGDVIVKQEEGFKESKHDFFLRKFEYTKALDHVLKPYIQAKHPEYTYSVLKELKRRNGLKVALGGRGEKSLILLLKYIGKYITDQRFCILLMEVMDQVLDLYGPSLGSCPATDKLFIDIRKRMDREARNVRQLMTLQGVVDLILTASHSSDQPELRSEEIAFKEAYKKSSKHDKQGAFKDKSSKHQEVTTPSKTVLSWEKTLIYSVS